MMRAISLMVMVSALALAGCSSNPNGGDPALAASRALFDSIKSRAAGAGAPAGPPIRIDVTRKQLNQTPGPVMQVIPDNTQAQDFLRLIARRDDSNPGTIEVWQSSDDAQVILRNGVLVGTKGLGGDIRSAEAEAAFAGFDGQGGGGQRLITIDRTNGTAQTVAFSCDMTQLGRETIQIVDQRISTYRMREDCSNGQTSFTNEYWVETGSGRMRKSRQWAGPTFGYIDFLRLQG